ncbi:hypothetical protein OGAPHI_002785 [Ogataea philodendri]|uniref:Uncharacterized protein n=1 Tax=Ogataea philodendri TaxID=1378263 RepID=A0A9P8P8M5_9ASCO|nr:uncharacterized protein OGAPHI_002785 [Ogataea philodendri]KAH3667136.1 hypothetical protein OGAPHI_002785 [Ogataea philodendri]
MESYLKNAPPFLVPPIKLPEFVQVDPDNRTDANKHEIEPRINLYSKYYDKLNRDGLLYEPNADSATARYYKQHHLYTPQVLQESITPDMPPYTTQTEPFVGSSNLVRFPDLFAGDHVPCLIHHSIARLGYRVCIFGGLARMEDDEYELYLRDLTNDFQVPASNIHMEFDYDLPEPLSKNKLTCLAMRPNTTVYIYNVETSTMLQMCELDGINTPPPLLCSMMQPLSAHHWLCHAGFELETHVRKENGHVYVTRKIVPQTSMWMFDIRTNTFTKLRAILGSELSEFLPQYIPRFGHGCHGITLEQNNAMDDHDSRRSDTRMVHSRPAVVFVMGGYKMDPETNRFIALNDLWKCEISVVNSQGTFDTAYDFQFSTEIICSLLGRPEFIDDRFSFEYSADGEFIGPSTKKMIRGLFRHGFGARWPRPRGFFSLNLVKSQNFYNQFDDVSFDLSSPVSRISRQREGTVSPSTDTGRSSPFMAPPYSSPAIRDRTLVVYGGSSTVYFKLVSNDGKEHGYYRHEILGDMWCFDLMSESWNYVPTAKHSDGQALKICGHASACDGETLMVLGGLREYQLPDSRLLLQCEDPESGKDHWTVASSILESLSEPPGRESDKLTFNFYVLNFATRKWKYAHTKLVNQITDVVMSHSLINAHAQAVQIDSKVVIVGGDSRKLGADHRLEADECQNQTFGGVCDVLSLLMKF